MPGLVIADLLLHTRDHWVTRERRLVARVERRHRLPDTTVDECLECELLERTSAAHRRGRLERRGFDRHAAVGGREREAQLGVLDLVEGRLVGRHDELGWCAVS